SAVPARRHPLDPERAQGRHSPARRFGVGAVRSVLAAPPLICLIVAACGGGPVPPTPTPLPTPTATAGPRSAPSPPVAILDPSMTAGELFDDDLPAGDLNLVERSRETRETAVVRDVSFSGADGQPVPAFLVVPASGTTRGAVLFLHWLGDDFSSRVAIGLQVRTIRRALTVLARDAGNVHLALVGHDYGAMYAILVASVDPRVAALAAMTPDATWVNWFVEYFHVVAEGDAAGYAQAMADLDPVTRIASVKAPVLLQFGTADTYVSGEVATALSNAARGGTLLHSYDVGHRLNGPARDDRDAWVLQELGVPVPTLIP